MTRDIIQKSHNINANNVSNVVENVHKLLGFKKKVKRVLGLYNLDFYINLWFQGF